MPDYLMGSSAGNWKIPLAIGALAAVLVMLVWQSLGPWEKVTELFAKVPVTGQLRNVESRRIELDVITETEQGPPGVAANTPSPIVVDSDDTMPPGANATPVEESPIEEDIIVDTELSGPPGIDALTEAKPPQPATEQERGVESSTEAPPSNEADVTVELKAISDQGAQPDASRINNSAGSQAVWLPSDARASKRSFFGAMQASGIA
ncbi:MAG: hypothetical protein R3C56_09975 [Pirellulaceae bacterium]